MRVWGSTRTHHQGGPEIRRHSERVVPSHARRGEGAVGGLGGRRARVGEERGTVVTGGRRLGVGNLGAWQGLYRKWGSS